jgi:hypothetical protein
MEDVLEGDAGGDRLIERYLIVLERALQRVGVRGHVGARVLAEAHDHLSELAREHGESEAVTRFGSAEQLAETVAAQLATSRSRRATYGSFGALVVVAAGYLGFFAALNLGGGGPDIFAGRSAAVGVLAGIGTFVFPQIAFVAGSLALLRALRLRSGDVLPAGELEVMRSRASVAVAAGWLTIGSCALYAVEFWSAAPLEPWVGPAILGMCALVAVPLAAGGAALVRAASPRAAPGPAGDVFDDFAPVFRLGPLRSLPGRPWLFGVLFATGVGLLGFALGWTGEGDPGSGIVRGVFEGVAVLVCFAALGRRLALRR